MNCPSCGYVNPDNIENCLRCRKELPRATYYQPQMPGYQYYYQQLSTQTYAPVYTQAPQYYYPPPPSEETVNRHYNKWLIFSPGVLMPLAGFFFISFLSMLQLYVLDIQIMFAVFYIIIPITACILMAMGYYKLGGIIIIINGVLTFPLGMMVSIFPGISGYRFGKLRNFYINSGVPAPPYLAKRVKEPSRNMKLAGVVCIILVIILPISILTINPDKPELEIDYVNVLSIDGGKAINITVKLGNTGKTTASRTDVDLKFSLSHQTLDRRWSGYSLWPDESQIGYFEITLISSSERLEKVTVYFMGESMDTYKVEYY